ncbi:4500_t:CDS:2, partial [Dentiscutata heterogama]
STGVPFPNKEILCSDASYQQLPQQSSSVQNYSLSSSSPVINTTYTVSNNAVAQKRAIELISDSEKELTELRAMA